MTPRTMRARPRALAAREGGDADERSLVIVGQGALQGETGGEARCRPQLAEALGADAGAAHAAAGRVGAMDVGHLTEGGMEAALDGADVIYNLGAPTRSTFAGDSAPS